MKNKKMLLGLLLIVVMSVSAALFVSCNDEGNPNTGKGEVYYLYENGELNKSDFIRLNDGKWSDDDNESGSYVLSGSSITIYLESDGEKEEFATGTLKDGVLTVTVLGVEITYCKEGKTPSEGPAEQNKVTVSFDADGGVFSDNTKVKTESIKKGNLIKKPSSPTREGYIFAGWSIDKNPENLWNFGENQVNENLTLYAVWTFDDGHSITSAAGFEISDITLKTITISLDGTYDLRDRFAVSKGATWRAFSSAECAQPTEITKRIATIEYGWNDVYVLVENQTTYESTVYNLKIYRAPVSSVTLLKNDTYEIDKGVDFPEVILPSEYDGKKITSIGYYAFRDCASITSVVIPDSVTGISIDAFRNCHNIVSVTLGKGLEWIAGSFDECYKIVEIINKSDLEITAGSWGYGNLSRNAKTVHNGESKIVNKDGYLFITLDDVHYLLGCIGSKTLTELTLPASYNDENYEIYRYAFWNSRELTSIVIPDGVTSIGDRAFDYCYKLVEIINKSNLEISTKYGSVGYYAKVIHNGESKIVNKDGYLFITVDSVNYLMGYIGVVTELILPADYNGKNYKIYNYAFCSRNNLENVVIPDKVTEIGESAFSDCIGLTAVTIGKSVTRINESAFYGCSGLKDVVIPDGVTSIGSYVFKNCSSLTSVTLGNGLTSIGYEAFYGCSSLTSVTLGSGVTRIGSGAFKECTSITNLHYRGTIDQWVQIDFVDYRSNPLSYAGDLYINNELVTKANITTATKINYTAFQNCRSLVLVTIGNSVTDIGESAFGNCKNLTSVTIGNGVKSIGKYAFESCVSLINLTIGNSVRGIGDYAFNGCVGLTILTLPDTVWKIGRYAFYKCTGLISVTIPADIREIKDYSFSGCYKIVEVINKSNLKITAESTKYGSVGYYAKVIHDGESKIVNKDGYLFIPVDGVNYLLKFTGDKTVTELNLPEDFNGENYVINDYVFENYGNLTSVVISDSVTSIGRNVFKNCSSLTSVTLGNGLTSIGYEAFYGCSSLTSVTLGSGVTRIGSGAFEKCTSITNLHYCGTIDQWVQIDFGYNPLYYAENLYINNELVTNANITAATKINDNAFYYYRSLMFVTIGDSVTSIGDSAFTGCNNLTSVTIGKNVKNIGDNAFNDCYKLIEVINESELTINVGKNDNGYVGYYAKIIHNGESKIVNKDGYLFITVDNVNYLVGYIGTATELTLPESYNGENYKIYDYAFCFRNNLENVVVSDKVTDIGDFAFYNCRNLKSVVIPDNSVGIIGNFAFFNCKNLKSVTIGDGVKSIQHDTFGHCVNLTSVVIPVSVDYIEVRAFEKCDSLTSVYYKGTAEQWKKIYISSDNSRLTDATRYYYSESQPSESGNYWRYVDGEIVIWNKEN